MSSLNILIESLYESKAYSDVTFVGNDGSKHEFHRDIIGRHSPVIKAMLMADEKKVEVPFDYDGATLLYLRRYIYTKNVSSFSNPCIFTDYIVAWHVWRFAHQYDFNILMNEAYSAILYEIPRLPINTLQKLMICVENSAVDKALITLIIDTLVKYVDKEAHGPCKILECKDDSLRCCKCVSTGWGLGFMGFSEQKTSRAPGRRLQPAVSSTCAKEFCCQHRLVVPLNVESKKRAFDTFAAGFVTFKPETQIAILRVKYNI